MHLTLSYSDGRILEAVVLSASADRMRISIPDYEDVVELRMDQDNWILESGEPVEIESIILAGAPGTLVPEVRPLTHKASSWA